MTNSKQPYDRKFKVTHSIKDIYKLYKAAKIKKGEQPISEKEYKRIVYKFNESLSNSLIDQALSYKIPWGLGYLRIKKTKMKFKVKNGRLDPNRKLIDWGSSRKLWYKLYPNKTLKELKDIKDKPILYYTNEHTNGEIMRWYWDKMTCKVPNRTVYLFHPVKQNRIKLTNFINNESTDAFEY